MRTWVAGKQPYLRDISCVHLPRGLVSTHLFITSIFILVSSCSVLCFFVQPSGFQFQLQLFFQQLLLVVALQLVSQQQLACLCVSTQRPSYQTCVGDMLCVNQSQSNKQLLLTPPFILINLLKSIVILQEMFIGYSPLQLSRCQHPSTAQSPHRLHVHKLYVPQVSLGSPKYSLDMSYNPLQPKFTLIPVGV